MTVRELRYYGSQSWPFPHSLMVAFTARGRRRHRAAGRRDRTTLFALYALPAIARFSISGHLIRDTVVGLGGPEPDATASPVR